MAREKKEKKNVGTNTSASVFMQWASDSAPPCYKTQNETKLKLWQKSNCHKPKLCKNSTWTNALIVTKLILWKTQLILNTKL